MTSVLNEVSWTFGVGNSYDYIFESEKPKVHNNINELIVIGVGDYLNLSHFDELSFRMKF